MPQLAISIRYHTSGICSVPIPVTCSINNIAAYIGIKVPNPGKWYSNATTMVRVVSSYSGILYHGMLL